MLASPKCDFKTSFRYNLNRHIANQHENSENVSMSVQLIPVELVAMKASNIKNLLTDLKLHNLLTNFESNRIDVDFKFVLKRETEKVV